MPTLTSTRLPRPVLSALIVVVLLLPAPVEAGRRIVRNTTPQRSMSPPGVEQPLYFPRGDRDPRLASDASAPEHLLDEFIAHHTAMRYDAAEETAAALVAMAPRRPLPHYNHACALARMGREEEAARSLQRAVELGWRNVAHTLLDPDLRRLALGGRLAPIVEDMRARAAQERIAASVLRDDDWNVVAADVEAAVPALLGRYQVPGAAVALLHEGRVVWSRGFGLANERTGARLETDTSFSVALLDDLLLLMAAAQLDEANQLDLGRLLLEGSRLAAPRPASAIRPPRVAPARHVFTAPPAAADSARPDAGRFADPAQWPSVADTAKARHLLRTAVEIAARESYSSYRRRCILAPLGIDRASAPAAGHSRLGTPFPCSPRGTSEDEAAEPLISARDAGRLAELLFHAPWPASAPHVLSPAAADRVIDAGAFGLGPMGLAVHTDETRFGTRVQVTGVRDGQGCLMRWYPEHGRGVVVLFNAETGAEAAVRIALTALGGC